MRASVRVAIRVRVRVCVSECASDRCLSSAMRDGEAELTRQVCVPAHETGLVGHKLHWRGALVLAPMCT
eukprot:14317550-Alexandrium_andersonii.AAC.1